MVLFKIITTAMVFVVVSYIVGLLGFHWRTQKFDRNVKILTPPKSILYISIAITLGIAIGMLLIIFLANSAEAFLSIFLLPFLLMGIWLILYSANWEIDVQKNTFIFRNMFGKKKEYKFDEIVSVKRIKIGGFKIYIYKKCITVDYWILGIDNLWDILKVMSFKSKK